MQNRVLLTFDLEDFINSRSFRVLYFVLKLLEKYNLRGIFFVTGHMAEKFRSYPKIVSSLEAHEIGFHSTSHSVRPTIFEYCDAKNYADAFSNTLKRETAHINPLSGEIEEKGGIYTLEDLFPSKHICAYRAPGYSCPPPHLEAIASLGTKYDFSMNLSKTPVSYKGITFFPRPIFLDCEVALLGDRSTAINWAIFLRSIFMKRMTILNFHLDRFVNKDWWDSIFHKGNPVVLSCVSQRGPKETKIMFRMMEVLLKMMSVLERSGVIDTLPMLYKSEIELDTSKVNIEQAVDAYTHWPRTFFGYEPKYAYSQFSRFFS